MRWAGVDVGGRRKGFDVAVVDAPDRLYYLGRIRTAELVAELLSEQRPDIIAVDSPYRPAPDGALSREGERLLARSVCNIRFTPDEATLRSNPRYYEWVQHGFELYALLEAAGLDVIECFPTASWTRFGGPRGSQSRATWSARSLDQMDIKLVPPRLSQDSRDAVAAALTARAAALGEAERFGDIVVPIDQEKAMTKPGTMNGRSSSSHGNEVTLRFPLGAPSTAHFVSQVAPVGTVLYHYTKSTRAIRGVLPEMRLLMSSFTAMGDPREFKDWSPYAMSGGSSEAEQTFADAQSRLNALKQHFKLLALTMDDKSEPTDWGRGYARPRMWQYLAKGGTGVCLVFDRDELVDAICSQLNQIGRFAHGPVKYENRFMRDEITLDLTRDAGIVVEEIVVRHLAALFFIKTTDWASEHEYRFVVESPSKTHIEVDISGLLRVVILGPEVSDEDEAAIRGLILNLRAKGETTRMGSLAWWNSYPLHNGLSID